MWLHQVLLFCTLMELPLRSHICLSPSQAGHLQQMTDPNPCSNHVSQYRNFAEPWFWRWQWQQVSFHKQASAHLVKMCHIQARDQILPPISKESLHRQKAWSIKQAGQSSKVHITYIGEASRSAKPYRIRDPMQHGTIGPLLHKDNALKNKIY